MTSLLEITVFYFSQSQIFYSFVTNSRSNKKKTFYVINHNGVSTYAVEDFLLLTDFLLKIFCLRLQILLLKISFRLQNIMMINFSGFKGNHFRGTFCI